MKTAIAFGAFDGLHAGHRAVLDKTRGYKRIAVTFSHLPKFDKKGNGLLMTLEDRKAALLQFGMDEAVCLDFEKIKDMPPLCFLQFIKEEYDPALIACGADFHFGKNAAGDISTLELFCAQSKIILSVTSPVKADGAVISSSIIRELIASGEMEKANSYLYTPYRFTSIVRQGDMRGRKLGFPTVNQDFPEGLIIPKSGVYAARAAAEGLEYPAVCNIGVRPTFKTENIAAETHIIGFSGNLYGKQVTVYPTRYLREEKKFAGIHELADAIKKDITEVEK